MVGFSLKAHRHCHTTHCLCLHGDFRRAFVFFWDHLKLLYFDVESWTTSSHIHAHVDKICKIYHTVNHLRSSLLSSHPHHPCHLVIRSFGHLSLVILSSRHLIILSFCLPVILSSCHSVILLTCNPVTLSSCHSVILSLGHPSCHPDIHFSTYVTNELTHNTRGYMSALHTIQSFSTLSLINCLTKYVVKQ